MFKIGDLVQLKNDLTQKLTIQGTTKEEKFSMLDLDSYKVSRYLLSDGKVYSRDELLPYTLQSYDLACNAKRSMALIGDLQKEVTELKDKLFKKDDTLEISNCWGLSWASMMYGHPIVTTPEKEKKVLSLEERINFLEKEVSKKMIKKTKKVKKIKKVKKNDKKNGTK